MKLNTVKECLLEAKKLAGAHGKNRVFSDIDLQLKQGEVVALLGPNGCGKTTLLRTLLGLHPKTAGEVFVRGESFERIKPQQRARLLSYVPQYHKMAFAYPVLEMVLMAAYGEKAPWLQASAEQVDGAKRALAWMGIEHLATKPYTQLSGGQRQMVLIARAYAQNTPMIMMDEPTNGLDYGNQIKLLQRVEALADAGKTVLMTTHHPEHALQCASRAMTMKNGRLIANGCPHKVLNPASIRELYELCETEMPSCLRTA
ncbi:iron(III) ABC transporter ATP-binding protein [Thiosulfatimonas sediminis]|uniref:Iron(III) ABC transporter ATP-binding protein n=1 Tax=Thiosulfatimonas sediminis TaxID=2675054 RepID=A0A6F8PUE6_9GAMM|nr:ABC transporter ATP-binding protein [Thiosulfatimonas sediminis]BBP45600.1 iron(III) ABC transporter ATP-binding protein [Thiosulfatimonas sediminis]